MERFIPLAKINAILFHPILMPLYLCILVFNTDNPFFSKEFYITWPIYIHIIFFTIIMPLVSLFILKKLKRISSYSLIDKKERVLPLALTFIFYFICSMFLKMSPGGLFIRACIQVSMLLMIIISFISTMWKISIHSAALGSVLAVLVFMAAFYKSDILPLIYICIAISGLQMFSRLLLGRHLPSQVYAGYSLGFALMFSVLVIYG